MSYQTLQDALHRALIVDPPEPPHDPPRRIQLRRTKGWRKPEGAIVVARPSHWGNWYVIKTAREWRPNPNYALIDDDALIVAATDKRGHWTGAHWGGFANREEATRFAVDLYARSLEATFLDIDGPLNRSFYLDDLRGHDLACWCPLDAPCHADVLLRLANPAPLTECRDCWGTDPRCPVCHGAGWWRG